MGLGIGAAVGFVLWSLITANRLASMMLLFPMILDVTSQQCGGRQSTNWLRLCTGLLGGVGVSGLAAVALNELIGLVFLAPSLDIVFGLIEKVCVAVSHAV